MTENKSESKKGEMESVVGGMFAMSPRTYNQTCRGAPKEFLGAQEVDVGMFDREKIGMAIPAGWDQQPHIKTRTELLQKRRAAKRPDPSFDLDGDGLISREDFTYSNRFDEDKDGKLDSQERARALEAVRREHPQAKFDALRALTAPTHGRTGWNQGEEAAGLKTRTALNLRRRKEKVEHSRAGYERYEAAAAAVQPAWRASDAYREVSAHAAAAPPPARTRSEEEEKARRDVRLRAGLTETMVSVNPARLSLDPVAHVSGLLQHQDPARLSLMGYRDRPGHPTRRSLLDARRTLNVEELEAAVARTAPTFKGTAIRLQEREDAIFLEAQLALSDPTNRVRTDLLQARRERNRDELIDKWGAEPPPPENEARAATPSSRRAFWTLKPGYTEGPEHTSLLAMTQDRKWFKQPERFFQPAPASWGDGGPVDPYQRPYTRPDPRKSMLAPKVTEETTPFHAVPKDLRVAYRPRPELRPEIRKDDPGQLLAPHYLTLEALESTHHRDMTLPLFSSFTPDFVYCPRALPAARPAGRPPPGPGEDGEGAEAGADGGGDGGSGPAARKPPRRPDQAAGPPRMREILARAAGGTSPGTASLQRVRSRGFL